ncbi:BLOC-2 complex member HPS5 homolog [Macrobrachium nipponense]|uniref:BLOC-2 complex member HPS5 homolog n=1 Tax=Macrobrachium nipponense TaxID=159736 RepID=UPI0030C81739
MSLPYVVLQYNDLQQLNFIQQGSTRLRVACFDLCPSLIVLGANSGTIYILDHDTLKLKHQIPTGNGSVVQLSISPDECHVAYALSNGSVEVFEVSTVMRFHVQ